MQSEAEQPGDPAHQQQEQCVYNECNQTESEDVNRKCDYPNEVADYPIDHAEDQSDQQIGEYYCEGVPGWECGDGNPWHNQGGQPQGDRVNDQTQ